VENSNFRMNLDGSGGVARFVLCFEGGWRRAKTFESGDVTRTPFIDFSEVMFGG
jgi:hypothetical protein